MPKRLVLCCDGTWNRPDQFSDGVPATTNVAKIALGLADRDEAGMEQFLHYQPGVGTLCAGRQKNSAVTLRKRVRPVI